MSNKLDILKVRSTNFLSIGPIFEFDFDNHKGLTYIYGRNNDIKVDSGEDGERVKNGVGKCLEKDTEVEIEFTNEETRKLFCQDDK